MKIKFITTKHFLVDGYTKPEWESLYELGVTVNYCPPGVSGYKFMICMNLIWMTIYARLWRAEDYEL